MEKRQRKVKIYGLDSTKDIRARLIEILQERALYHKDKFVAPILWDEMRAMEVKKSGKVEHSDKTHDDNVFSYLMALYVWYDGKNLVENFGIRKSSLKTDDNLELEEIDVEDALEKKEKIDFRSSMLESNDDIAKTLEWVEADVRSYKTAETMQVAQFFENKQQVDLMIAKYQSESEIDIGVISNNISMPTTMQLPNSLFDDIDIDEGDYIAMTSNGTPLAGNLSNLFNNL